MSTYTGWDSSTKNDIFKPGLRKLFDTTHRDELVFYKPMVNDLRTKQYIEDDRQIASFELPGLIAEGENIPLQNPVFGASKTYTQQRMGTGFRVTHAMDYFNLFKLTKRWTQDLKRVQLEGKDVEIHRMFNAPAATTAICGAGYDTLDLAEAVHTGLASGTADNYNNYPAAALTTAAVESMRYYFRTLKDDMGILMTARPDILFFEPTLFFKAKEIFKSDLKAHELSNTTNIIRSDMGGINLYENPRLTSTSMWGAMAKNDDNFDINVFTSMDPELYTKDAPDNTKDTVVASHQYFTYGFGSARLYYQGNI